MGTVPSRIIYHTDAIAWLRSALTLEGCSIITSLPDISEFAEMSLEQWKSWFVQTAALVLSRTPDDGLTIFFQSDIKREGAWVDKGYLCQKSAEAEGHTLVGHKIVCRVPPSAVTFGRPAYSHLLSFSKNIRPDVSHSFADVLPEAGDVTWARGMGLKACELSCQMVLRYTRSHTVVDPFCGHGSVLTIANSLGLNAIGVDRSLKCVKRARTAQIAVEQNNRII
jgi:hypothetical protein